MTLLHPWAASLALLAIVPLALHLLRRETRRRVAFPAIRYLQSAHRSSARALRLRDRLLMVLRVALLLALAAAAAVPLVGRGDAADHRPTDVVLILDNTASMNRVLTDGSLLARQRERGLAVLRNAGPGDRFWVLPAVGGPLTTAGGAGEAIAGLLRVEATDATASLGPRVREAVRMLPPDPDRTREIHVFSDFQATGLTDSQPPLPDHVHLLLSRVPAEETNGAVLRVAVTPPGPAGGGDVAAELALFGEQPGRDTVQARLVLDDETVAIARSETPGLAVFRLPVLAAGEHRAAVEIPPSGLRADDRRPFVVRVVEPPRVRHEGPSDSYVRRGLATLAAAGSLILWSEEREELDVWVIEGTDELAAGLAGGAGLVLIPPAEEVLLARFNVNLERHGIPWRLAAEVASGELGLESSPDVVGLERARVARRHRLVRHGVTVDSVLLRTSDGAPWLVSGEASGRRYVLVASPFDPASTSLPVDAAMVPFLEALLLRWTGLGGDVPPTVPAGAAVLLDADADSVRAPDGLVVPVDGRAPYAPRETGIHRVFAGDRVTLLAVGAPAAESDLAELDDASAADRLGAPATVAASTNEEWADVIYRERRGRSASPHFLLAALLLAVAEMFLATPGADRSAARRASFPEGAGR
jgi:hypothetical protein